MVDFTALRAGRSGDLIDVVTKELTTDYATSVSQVLSIQKMELCPGDIVFIELPNLMSLATAAWADEVSAAVRKTCGDVRVVFLAAGTKISVLRASHVSAINSPKPMDRIIPPDAVG